MRDVHHDARSHRLVPRAQPVIMLPEVTSMMTNERASIEDVLELARQLAVQLEPIVRQAGDTDGLCLRLAQAHALGLVDQLCEMAAGPQANSNARSAMCAALMLEEETRHTA